MPADPRVDVAAILAAVYRRPSEEVDALAERVRARLALLETASELLRLLVEVPASAVTATLGPSAESNEEEKESVSDD